MTAFLLGASLGWAAGISPGPLSALVLATALRKGFAAGVRVAVAPLFTDLPVVAAGVVAAAALPGAVVAGLTLAGGVYLVWLGVAELRAAGRPVPEGTGADLKRGVVVNLLSPHPWLFWMTVGGPLLVAAWRISPASAAGFLAGFYGLLIGTKVGLSALAAAGRRRLGTLWHQRLVKVGGLLLMVVGFFLLGRFLAALE